MNLTDASLRKATWFGGTTFVNPALNAVIADTGPVITPAEYSVYVSISATANSNYTISHRDAANATDLEVNTQFGAANTPYEDIGPVRIANTNERVRVIMAAALTGSINCTIKLTREYD